MYPLLDFTLSLFDLYCQASQLDFKNKTKFTILHPKLACISLLTISENKQTDTLR